MTENEETAARPAEPSTWSHRRKWTVGLLAAAVLTATGVVGCDVLRTDPEDVMGDYLDALLAGDAEAALAFTREMPDFDTASDAFLTDEAMSGNWRAGDPVPRDEDEDSASFDVTITAADDTSHTGRFIVDRSDSGDWKVANPLVKVDLSGLPTGFAEFNGEVVKAKSLKGSEPVGEVGVKQGVEAWLFPGAYSAFGGSDGLELSAKTFVAVPDARNTVEATPVKFLPEITVGDDLAAEADAQLRNWIDECAESTEVNPPGCPFAGGSRSEPDRVSPYDGRDLTVDKVKWKVESYPRIRLMQTVGWFAVVEVEPGEVTISGKGVETYEPDEGSRAFSSGCAIDLKQAVAELAEPGTFAFAPALPGTTNQPLYSCSLRYH